MSSQPIGPPRRVPRAPAATPVQASAGQDKRQGVRLNKRLAELGWCSRREADDWIARGWVLVDGRPAVLGQLVDAQARLELDPQARGAQQQQVTILLHKPLGYVSGQAEDGHQPAATLVRAASRWRDDRTAHRFDSAQLRGLAPAGRLDIDSTGLLVLTQDGRVARQLIGEDSQVEKEYLVRVSLGPVAEGVRAALDAQAPLALQLLRHGLSLDGVALKRAQVEWINDEQLRFVLTEGRKRQIRRMCERMGLQVVGLKRVRIGGVRLGPLPAGQWRYLAPGERF